nr:MAG TPA: hypothetical protein [Caudoviricetes sp.]
MLKSFHHLFHFGSDLTIEVWDYLSDIEQMYVPAGINSTNYIGFNNKVQALFTKLYNRTAVN